MANSPSDEEDAPLDSCEEGDSPSEDASKTVFDKIEDGESAPDSGEAPEHLVLDEFKHVAVWLMLQIFEALIEYWIILILSNGHGPV